MEIEEGLVSYLSNDAAAIIALIGDRLYPQNLPQNPAYDAMTYTMVSEITVMAHDGPLDLVECRFQFDCFSRSFSDAERLARALRRQLDGFRGQMGDVPVHAVFFLNALDAFEDPARVFRVPVDFLFQWKEI